MKKHEHDYCFAHEIKEIAAVPLHKYVCKCGDIKWIPKAEERITSRSPIGVIYMDEPTSPAVDPKKEAQRAKQAEYRQKRYQLKKAGQWTGHMPK